MLDIIGRPVNVGDFVLYGNGNVFRVFKVVQVTDKECKLFERSYKKCKWTDSCYLLVNIVDNEILEKMNHIQSEYDYFTNDIKLVKNKSLEIGGVYTNTLGYSPTLYLGKYRLEIYIKNKLCKSHIFNCFVPISIFLNAGNDLIYHHNISTLSNSLLDIIKNTVVKIYDGPESVEKSGFFLDIPYNFRYKIAELPQLQINNTNHFEIVCPSRKFGSIEDGKYVKIFVDEAILKFIRI